MRVSEGLRKYYEKLFPGIPIDEVMLKETEKRTWGQFYQVANSAESRLSDLMVRVPADILRTRNGIGSIPGDPSRACEMLVMAIGGVQALELVAAQHAAELDLFTPEYMETLLKQSGLA